MKIGFLVPGGVDRSLTHRVIPALLALIERTAARHELVVFALQRAPRPESYSLLGATIRVIARRPVRLRALAAVRAEHRRAPCHVLHAFWAVPCGEVASVAGRLLDVPVVVHVAGGELVSLPEIGYGGSRTAAGRRAVKRALVGATRITAASSPLIATLERAGFAAERVPLGIDRTRWPERPPRPRTPGAPARLIQVANLNRVKDQDTLLRALARLASASVPFTLDLVGEDTLDGAARRLTAELGLTDRVRFHGFVSQNRLRSLVEAADLFLVSSRHEAGPVAMLEAALAGVPSVGTAVGHVAEWDGAASIAVPVGDADALADAVAMLLADDTQRLRLAAEAQRLALAMNADATASRFDQLYREVAAARTAVVSSARVVVELPVLGLPVRFESNATAAINAVRRSFGLWRQLPDSATSPGRPVVVRIEVRAGNAVPYRRPLLEYDLPAPDRLRVTGPLVDALADVRTRYVRAIVDASLVADEAHFRYALIEALTLFTLTKLDRVPLHAAAIEDGDRLVLLSGNSGIGKSSLCQAASQAGLHVLSDDTVYIEIGPPCRVWPQPGWIRLARDAARFFPELAPIRDEPDSTDEKLVVPVPSRGPSDLLPRPAEQVVVCALERSVGPGLERIGAAQLEARLLDTLEGGFALMEAEIRLGVGVLAARGGWLLRLPPHPEAAMPLLLRALAVPSR